MPRTTVKAKAQATRDAAARTALTNVGTPQLKAVTADSFLNFAHKLGIGADSPLSTGSYGFNPITRNRILLEWIHRGSWIGGLAVDIVADDMTRRGVEFTTEIPPDQSQEIERTVTNYNVWGVMNETIKWGRLYGGGMAVALIDGQDPREPLRLKTIGPGMFKGLLALDRWMVEPSLNDLVTEYGPHLGMPKYYKVTSAAPALRNQVIHHSRVMVRHVGIELPYQQRLQELLWGISVLERLYDRMVMFDSATTGAGQLVYKSYLRTLSVKSLRQVVAAGGKAVDGLSLYVDMMRRFQGIEGITVIDADDTFEAQTHAAFSGLSDVLVQFGQQVSGALQIPLVRLFGQSPAGLNSTGESDLTTYYDHIKRLQQKDLLHGVTQTYQLIAASKQIQLPPDFGVDFRPLRELDDKDKADIASSLATTITSAYESGLISQQTALKELRQQSRRTNVFTNITANDIILADDVVQPPAPEAVMPPGEGDVPPGADQPQDGGPGPVPGGVPQPAKPGVKQAPAISDKKDGNSDEIRPQGKTQEVVQGSGGRVVLHR